MPKIILIILAVAIFLTACYKVPVTGRKQVNMLPESIIVGLSVTSYGEFLSKNKVLNSGSNTEMVKRAGGKIAGKASSFLAMRGQSNRVKDFKWEFNLVDDNTVNAWCMPGGKVVFYTGILPLTKDETGVAVVMGHEIAHAIARHGNERVSQGLLVAGGTLLLNEALKNKPKETRNLVMAGVGAGATVGILLPFSREHEAEADKMGLVFMALAGYDPRKAVDFWQRMAAGKKSSVPEFLSTHPSDERRIKNITEFLPTAMKYYKGS